MKNESYKIGIFGSAEGDEVVPVVEKARMVGEALAARGCTLVTGACAGLPYAAAYAAAKKGAPVWGFAFVRDRNAQMHVYPDQDISIYEKLVYLPSECPFADDLAVAKKYRNVISTEYVDAGIIIAGRWGTLHEFCSLYDYGKVIGVLTTTGGVADELLGLMKKIEKESNAKVFFNRAPEQLVETIVQELARRKSI